MRICNFYFSDFHLRRDSCPSGRNVLIFVCASKHIQGFHSKLVNFQLTLTLSQLIVSFSISKLSLPPIENVTYNLNWHLSNLTFLLQFVTCHCSNWNCASNSFVRTTTKQKQNLPLWLEHKNKELQGFQLKLVVFPIYFGKHVTNCTYKTYNNFTGFPVEIGSFSNSFW